MAETVELQQLLDDTVRDLAQALPEPALWDEWIAYFLEALELQAMELDAEHPEAIEVAFENIKESLIGRLQEGRW